jgi:dTDP-4-amino-4,6-dideoxygalactose transaminase
MKSTNAKIYLARPDIRGNERAYCNDAIESGWVTTLGPYVDKLEAQLADYTGMKAACATASGTSAIHLALKLAGVQQDDVVLCASLTFSASANPIMYEKAKPVFIDSEPSTYNMSPIALEKALKQYKPKAVIVVDLYGQAADMDPLLALCRQYNACVIEDAAEALGATYKNKPCGSFGDYSIVSFNGNKIVTSSGGGMLLSDDADAIEKARFWATQAREPARHYEHKEVGYNYRLSNVSAAIGCAQFEKLDERIAAKKHIYDRYMAAFAGEEVLEMLSVSEQGAANYWLSCARLSEESLVKPGTLLDALAAENIEARPIWKPMHLQPVFAQYEFFSHYEEADRSVSQDIFETGICLPSDTTMSDTDQDRVIATIQKVTTA